ncbi:MAG TPA: DNA ligase D [Candidatus Avamphibacillus sp.]|nr:DNA ligase D [Candidatus Avamphibacillus sp.]
MDVMKPIASTEIPKGDEWLYEVKYDGFRCVLIWEVDHIKLVSKNKKDLTANFPEIVEYCLEKQSQMERQLPLKLDGELVILNTPFQANFPLIQQRGRLKNEGKINAAAKRRPASLIAFDIIMKQGNSLLKESFEKRKRNLHDLFTSFFNEENSQLRLVQAYSDANKLWNIIFESKAEGIIAKRKTSPYQPEKKHHDWWKIKNWRRIHGILTSYNMNNGYFTVNVFDNGHLKPIGKCKHGLEADAFDTLKELFTTKGEKQENIYTLPPAIVATIHTLDLYDQELREAEFADIAVNMPAEECTMEKLKRDLAMLPPQINYSNVEKVYWPEKDITKGSFLTYMRELAPYMIPFMKQRKLTLIRCPDGVDGEKFFQKHLPDYAPEFIDHILDDEGQKLIVCNHLASLMWFVNHGALEYHLPFQKVYEETPIEIVFDLDPPSREFFHLAIEAALLIKKMLDELELISFIKTSGGKGLQIHIPIPEKSMTYDETALFTQAIAWTVERKSPEKFTTERFKNKRNGRLYIDYVQHGKDKTIIAPYSTRNRADATVATPLFWEEVTSELRPETFTLECVLNRVQAIGCPFKDYFHVGERQKMNKLMKLISS